MRQRMMILAALAVTALAHSARADEPRAPLQTPFAKTAVVTPVAGGRAPTVVNGCGSCAANNSAFTVHNRHIGIGGGTVNPVGCGCCASEKTFLWGSCRQFFNPQHSCGRGCGAGGCDGRNPCPLPTYAQPFGVPANNCAGPYSYLMR